MNSEKRFSQLGFELRQAENENSPAVLRGVATPYSSRALIAGVFEEMFLPGAFGPIEGKEISLNIMHERAQLVARSPLTMTLTDSDESLTIEARPPKTRAGMDAIIGTQAGLFTGLSVHFVALEEEFIGNLRRISKANLLDIAVVDRSAYDLSTLEAEARFKEACTTPRKRRRIWL